MATRGIILEKTGSECIVLTPEGEFCRSRCPVDARPGDEIEVVRSRHPARYFLLVACLLVMLVAWQMYRLVLPPVAAYVALDINPSLELGLDREAVVVRVAPLDAAGERLVADLRLRGTPVDQALSRLVDRALQYHYLAREGDNAILVTVTPAGRDAAPVTVAGVARVLENEIRARDIPAKVVVAQATAEERERARRAGMSPGRFKLQAEARARGKGVPARELKTESLSRLERKVAVPLEDLVGGGNGKAVIRNERRPRAAAPDRPAGGGMQPPGPVVQPSGGRVQPADRQGEKQVPGGHGDQKGAGFPAVTNSGGAQGEVHAGQSDQGEMEAGQSDRKENGGPPRRSGSGTLDTSSDYCYDEGNDPDALPGRRKGRQ